MFTWKTSELSASEPLSSTVSKLLLLLPASTSLTTLPTLTFFAVLAVCGSDCNHKSNQIKSNQIKSINQLAERPATAECSLSDAGIALYRTESPRRSIDGVASKSTTQRQKIQKRNQPKCNNDNNDNNVHHHHHHQIGWRERLRVAPLATQPSKRGNKRETPSERALPAALRNSIVSADKQKKKVCQALISSRKGGRPATETKDLRNWRCRLIRRPVVAASTVSLTLTHKGNIKPSVKELLFILRSNFMLYNNKT